MCKTFVYVLNILQIGLNKNKLVTGHITYWNNLYSNYIMVCRKNISYIKICKKRKEVNELDGVYTNWTILQYI